MEVLVIILIILLMYLIIYIRRADAGQNTKYNRKSWSNNYTFHYDYSYMPYKRAYLFTKTEHAFFITLVREALKKKLLVCPKVRLEDITYVPKDIKNRQKYRGYVKSRHVDFALINMKCETVAAIELDDPSHDQEAATKTDQFKNELFKSIGVPLIRIKTGTDYITQLNIAFDTYNLNGEIKNHSS